MPDHAFRIASITKPYTSAVALRLFELGKLDLFAPVAPLRDSGTRQRVEAAGYGEAVLREPARIWTHDEQIALCMSLGDPLSRPGAPFQLLGHRIPHPR